MESLFLSAVESLQSLYEPSIGVRRAREAVETAEENHHGRAEPTCEGCFYSV